MKTHIFSVWRKKNIFFCIRPLQSRKKKRMWNVWRRLQDVIWMRSRVYVYVVLTQNYVHVLTIPHPKYQRSLEDEAAAAAAGRYIGASVRQSELKFRWYGNRVRVGIA